MARKAFDAQTDNAWSCANGESHNWIYQGKQAQSYLCTRCGVVIMKLGMKEATA